MSVQRSSKSARELKTILATVQFWHRCVSMFFYRFTRSGRRKLVLHGRVRFQEDIILKDWTSDVFVKMPLKLNFAVRTACTVTLPLRITTWARKWKRNKSLFYKIELYLNPIEFSVRFSLFSCLAYFSLFIVCVWTQRPIQKRFKR